MKNTTTRKGCIFVFLALFYCTKALSNSCPVVMPPVPLSEQDTACIEALETNIKDFTYSDIPLRGLRNELLKEFILANQQYVIDSFYVNYCELLTDETLNLSAKVQKSQLSKAKDILYATVPFPPPTVDSRNISAVPYLFDDAFTWKDFNKLAFVSFDDQLPGQESEAKQVLTSTTRTGWLREPPYFINKANKYFVIVGSVKSYEIAKQEVIRLKKKAPEYDFVAYAPYGGNTYHAIMVATWVPYSVAKAVVKKATIDIEKSSFIWACPREGDLC